MHQEHGIAALLGIYCAILGSLCLGGAYAFTRVASLPAVTEMKSKPATILNSRLASAREIKAALAKPQQKIEPLPPITAKAARAVPDPKQNSEALRKRALSAEARNAMAQSAYPASEQQPAYYSNDRTGLNGW